MNPIIEKEFLRFDHNKPDYQDIRDILMSKCKYKITVDEAENFVHEGIMKALIAVKNTPSFDVKNIYGLILTCAMRAFIDDYRKSIVRKNALQNIHQRYDSHGPEDPFEVFQRNIIEHNKEYILGLIEEGRFISDNIDKLIILASIFEGKSNEEIQKEFLKMGEDIKNETISVRKSRALKKIIKKVQAEFPNIKEENIHKK